MAEPRTPPTVPLRVVVMGASASVDTSFHGGSRDDLGYPRVTEAALWAAGHPAGPAWRAWVPGAAGGRGGLTRWFVEVVRQVDDPDVRTFPLAELVAELAPDGYETTPDGGHFTPPVHHAIGLALADEILG